MTPVSYTHLDVYKRQVVLAAFGQRRKTLRNTLKDWLKDEDFSTLQVDSQLRAENLSVADFVKIANYVS